MNATDRQRDHLQSPGVRTISKDLTDIFFKCRSCGKHLVADDAGAGQTINCPDCNTPTTIPEISTIHQRPGCRQRLKFSPGHSVIPEPSTLLMAFIGMAALVLAKNWIVVP